MSYKQHTTITSNQDRAVHTTDNRLARRLFELENRVSALEDKVNETTILIEMLFGIDQHEPGSEFSIRFCTCDLDDDDDDEDEDDDDDD